MNCNKKSFNTKDEAIKRINEIQLLEGNNKKPNRSYLCKNCNKYHLTSWSNKKFKDTNNQELKKEQQKIKKQKWYDKLAEYWIKKKRWNNLK